MTTIRLFIAILSILRLFLYFSMIVTIFVCIVYADFPVMYDNYFEIHDITTIYAARELYCNLLGTHENPNFLLQFPNEIIWTVMGGVGFVIYYVRRTKSSLYSAIAGALMVCVGLPAFQTLQHACSDLEKTSIMQLNWILYKGGVLHFVGWFIIIIAAFHGWKDFCTASEKQINGKQKSN